MRFRLCGTNGDIHRHQVIRHDLDEAEGQQTPNSVNPQSSISLVPTSVGRTARPPVRPPRRGTVITETVRAPVRPADLLAAIARVRDGSKPAA
jgi:hypothetical protein